MDRAEPPPLLAAFEGRVPDRPAWFDAALACLPERSVTPVVGADIETLAWGERGRPGLLLLHGKMAHADWWSFVAPFFAATHRVAALSFSGMGGSGWRDTYSLQTMADEAMAVADATGLFDGGGKPLVVAHSFGGFVALRLAEQHGTRLGGVVAVDTPLLSREQRQQREAARGPVVRGAGFSQRPTRIYPTRAAALARFRFAPPQDCENLFIADHIARASLKEVPGGWTWRFDPRIADVHPGNAAQSLQAAACPVALAWGGDSALVRPDVAAYGAGLAGPGTPLIEIPAARHHVMVDQPLAFISALRGLFGAWPPK